MPNTDTRSPDDRASAAEDLIVRADAFGRILFVSDACRSLGYEPEELIGRPGFSLVHPDDRDKFATNTAMLYSANDLTAPENRRHRFRCKDGSWVWLEGHPLVIEAGAERGELINVFRRVPDAG